MWLNVPKSEMGNHGGIQSAIGLSSETLKFPWGFDEYGNLTARKEIPGAGETVLPGLFSRGLRVARQER